MNRKERRAAALKAAQDIMAGAKAAVRDMTEDERKLVAEKVAEVEQLDKEIAAEAESDALYAKMAGFGHVDGEQADDQAAQAKSLGEHFAQHLKAKGLNLKTPGTIEAPEFKAATDTQAVGGADGAFGAFVVDIDRNPVMPFRRQLVVADLMGAGQVAGNAIRYPVFGPLEGGTGFVSEGGQKSQLHVGDPTWVTDALGEVAGWFKVTDDMAEDVPYIVSEINSTAVYDLQLKEEMALLSGNGTSPNLRGILNRSGVQTLAAGADSDPDRIFKGISNVQEVTGFAADGIVINPIDYMAIRLSKDSNGQYFGGGFFTGPYGNGGVMEQPPLWGLRTVVTSSIAQGTVLVGAFKAASKVFRKGGIRVDSTNSHVDDFTNDKITIRLRERLGLQVKYPAAFVKITLGQTP